jgi:hypothetical protein
MSAKLCECGSQVIKLDEIMDTPECGCNTWVCRECESELVTV